MQTTRTDRVARMAVAAFVAALFVLSPFAGILHSDAHGHRFCAEHQTFEDADRDANGVVIAATQEALQRQTPSPDAPDHAGSEAHAPCALAPSGLSDAVIEAHRDGASILLARAEISAPDLALVPPTLAPLFVAPKNSPPAARCLT